MTQTESAVWKFSIPVADSFVVGMPAGATILHVGLDPSDEPCFWALVTPTAEPERRIFKLRGTGHPVEVELRYIGSFVRDAFVGHLFER